MILKYDILSLKISMKMATPIGTRTNAYHCWDKYTITVVSTRPLAFLKKEETGGSGGELRGQGSRDMPLLEEPVLHPC